MRVDREHVSVFDVSHMLQTTVGGRDQVEFMESLVVGDVAGLADDHGTLTLFTNDNGGIIDDLIVTRTSLGHLYIVSNAACADKDFSHMSVRANRIQSGQRNVTDLLCCHVIASTFVGRFVSVSKITQ